MTREEIIAKAREEGAVWMMGGSPVVLLFWREDENGVLTRCGVVMSNPALKHDWRWLGWVKTIVRHPMHHIMERID